MNVLQPNDDELCQRTLKKRNCEKCSCFYSVNQREVDWATGSHFRIWAQFRSIASIHSFKFWDYLTIMFPLLKNQNSTPSSIKNKHLVSFTEVSLILTLQVAEQATDFILILWFDIILQAVQISNLYLTNFHVQLGWKPGFKVYFLAH